MTAATSLSGSSSGVADRIHSIVRDRPAIHFRGLKRAADVSSNGQLRHHIDQLQRENVIVELEDGGYTRFFITGQHKPELRDGLARFARRVPRVISRLLLSGSMIRTDLRQALGCADSTLGYHLNRMLEQGDIQRDRDDGRSLYSLTDPDFVRRVLAEFEDIDEGTQDSAPSNGAGENGGPANGTSLTSAASALSALCADEGTRPGDVGCWA